MAYRFTGSYPDAEELTHEIIIRTYTYLDRFDPDTHFGVWLNQVARNYCIDRYRARVREARRFTSRPVRFERPLGTRPPHPDRELEQRETREEVMGALAQLSPKLREAIRLRYLRELSYDVICERLGIPRGTLKSRLHRARAQMKLHLAEVRTPGGRRPGAAGIGPLPRRTTPEPPGRARIEVLP